MRQLGAYTLTQQIGAGGMAEVWMAQRDTLGGAAKNCALKLLASNVVSNPEYREMFLREARLSTLLNNSAIVQVFDAGEIDGECFIAMEWVDGMNLAQLNELLWERGEKLPLHVGVYVVGELLRALDYVHNVRQDGQGQIVHRDISPQNVMLSTAGEVKLMDFGVAHMSTEETSGANIKGKLRYMPIEQLSSSKEPSIDLYAVGALLHELIDGRRFRDEIDSQPAMVAAICSAQIPPLQTPASEVPPELEAVRQGLLMPEPKQRIGSARAALRMLAQWPGYRNAAFELEEYVTRYIELRPMPNIASINRTRSGLSGSNSGVGSPRSPGERSDTSVSKQQAKLNASTSPGQAASVEPAVRKPRRWTRVVAPLLATVGLAIFATSSVIAWRLAQEQDEAEAGEEVVAVVDEAQAQAQAQAEAESPSAAEAEPEPEAPANEPAPAADEAPARVAEPPPVAEAPTPVIEDEPEPPKPAVEDKPTSPTPPKAPAAKVSVEFVANEYPFVYVKVGREVLTLEPKKTKTLRASTHSIQISTTGEDGPWKSAGKIKLEAGHSYRVLMTKKPGAKVETLN